MVHKSYVPTHVNNQIFFLLMVLFVMPRYIKLKSVIQFVVLGVPQMHNMEKDVVILRLRYVVTHVKTKILHIYPLKVSFVIKQKNQLTQEKELVTLGVQMKKKLFQRDVVNKMTLNCVPTLTCNVKMDYINIIPHIVNFVIKRKHKLIQELKIAIMYVQMT